MRPFTTRRRPLKEWCGDGPADGDEKWVGKPIVVDLDSARPASCGGRDFDVLSGGIGAVVCDHVVEIGD